MATARACASCAAASSRATAVAPVASAPAASHSASSASSNSASTSRRSVSSRSASARSAVARSSSSSIMVAIAATAAGCCAACARRARQQEELPPSPPRPFAAAASLRRVSQSSVQATSYRGMAAAGAPAAGGAGAGAGAGVSAAAGGDDVRADDLWALAEPDPAHTLGGLRDDVEPAHPSTLGHLSASARAVDADGVAAAVVAHGPARCGSVLAIGCAGASRIRVSLILTRICCPRTSRTQSLRSCPAKT